MGGTRIGVRPGSLAAADWLSFAAAPAFAIMALLTAGHGGGPETVICSAAHGSSTWSGMVPMYLLMGVIHSAPWLKLASSRRKDAGGINDE